MKSNSSQLGWHIIQFSLVQFSLVQCSLVQFNFVCLVTFPGLIALCLRRSPRAMPAPCWRTRWPSNHRTGTARTNHRASTARTNHRTGRARNRHLALDIQDHRTGRARNLILDIQDPFPWLWPLRNLSTLLLILPHLLGVIILLLLQLLSLQLLPMPLLLPLPLQLLPPLFSPTPPYLSGGLGSLSRTAPVELKGDSQCLDSALCLASSLVSSAWLVPFVQLVPYCPTPNAWIFPCAQLVPQFSVSSSCILPSQSLVFNVHCLVVASQLDSVSSVLCPVKMYSSPLLCG